MTARRYLKPIGYLIVGLYFGWFTLAAYSNRPVEAVSRYLPGWVATMIWASALIVFPVMAGVFSVSVALRLSLAVLFLISSALSLVAFHSNPIPASIIGVAMCIEIFWMVRWRDKRRRNSEKTGGELTE